MRWLDGITDLMDMNWSKLRETVEEPGTLQATGLPSVRPSCSVWRTTRSLSLQTGKLATGHWLPTQAA